MSESAERPGFGWSMQEAWLAAWGWKFWPWKSEPDLSAVEPVVRSELALAAGGA